MLPESIGNATRYGSQCSSIQPVVPAMWKSAHQHDSFEPGGLGRRELPREQEHGSAALPRLANRGRSCRRSAEGQKESVCAVQIAHVVAHGILATFEFEHRRNCAAAALMESGAT